MTAIPDVSWSRVATFVRQHTHDLRNDLNGLDLEAALLADIVADPEGTESIARMRAEIRKVAANLRTLSAKFAEMRPTLMRLPAEELFLIWQDQAAEISPHAEVDWGKSLPTGEINIDPTGVASALREILANAHAFGTGAKLRVTADSVDGHLVLQLHEPKVESIEPANWGSTPFVSTRRGGYGLGLCDVVRTIEASGGAITWTFNPKVSELVTSIRFPLA
jgi:signal transduction histidine kinase